MLKVGNKAPNFSLQNTKSESVSLSDYKGQNVILWFYPKASTPGWTVQGQGFRDEFQSFKDKNTTIIGVSADSIQKNKNFKEKQKFQYELLSDENKTMIESYGAWVKKKMYGKEYMGIARISYLIDKDGIVSHVFDKVKTKSHALDVLNNL